MNSSPALHARTRQRFRAFRSLDARASRRVRVGCSIALSSNGQELTLRFRVLQADGTVLRCRERTGLAPTPENREKLRPTAEAIAADLRTGRFVYERWFPDSARRREQREQPPVVKSERPRALSIAGYYRRWIEAKWQLLTTSPPQIRESLPRLYRSDFKNHVLPALGDLELSLETPSLVQLKQFRDALRKKGLAEKTIRNVIDGSLRAMIRDADEDEIPVSLEAFRRLRWPKYQPPDPSPFPEADRDRLLEYLKTKTYRVGGFGGERRAHYPFFAYVHTLFFTGMRPSEAAALRLRHVDLSSAVGSFRVRASRHRGAEGPTKTPRSRRRVRLTPATVEVLRPLIPLRADPDGHLFLGLDGKPVKPENVYEHFVNAQRALGMTPIRDLYSTKDTFITWAHRRGVNDAWLEEQTGVSTATQRKHYRGTIADDEFDREQLERIAAASASSSRDGWPAAAVT